jgi:hypothetical protein
MTSAANSMIYVDAFTSVVTIEHFEQHLLTQERKDEIGIQIRTDRQNKRELNGEEIGGVKVKRGFKERNEDRREIVLSERLKLRMR